MTELILSYLPALGPWLLALTTFLSCLAVPVPSSLMMIAAGAFVAAGDLSLPAVTLSAYGGAVLGDQVGFALGRRAGRFVATAQGRRAELVATAAERLRRNGGITVFLSRWMFSALGPWVNLAAGASGYGHRHFTVAGVTGEAVWVGLYVALGIAFGANLQAAADLASNALGLLAAGAVAVALGWWLWRSGH
jgi:membrane protein DedA with SNARE-associated domain